MIVSRHRTQDARPARASHRSIAALVVGIASVGGACVVGQDFEPLEDERFLAVIAKDAPLGDVARAIEAEGALVTNVLSSLEIVEIAATADEVERIAALSDVIEIEAVDVLSDQDRSEPGGRAATASFAGGQQLSWGIEAIGGPLPPTSRALWVLDSGIDLTHRDLNIDMSRSIDLVVSSDGTTIEDTTHGTGVAGVAAALDNDIGTVGVAPGALVVSVRVLNGRGNGRLDTLIEGLDYTVANAAPGDVLNLSLAARRQSAVVDMAIERTANRGLSVVVAAGNWSSDTAEFTPAGVNHDGVYTVSASTQAGCLASFSNHGGSVDMAAPGVGITTLGPGADIQVVDGTSYASPHVAGLLLAGQLSSAGRVCDDQDTNAEPLAHR